MHHRRPRRQTAATLLCVLALLTLASHAAVAARPAGPWQPVRLPKMATHRATGPITVDGVLDDAGWQDVPRAGNFVEHQPGDQVQPPVPTEAMITYDDKYLYAAFICYDDPAEVRASYSERDRIWNDDYVLLVLDTFGDQNCAFELGSNAYGVQGDLLWSAGRGEDSTYDMVYHTSGRITDEGWQVEYAIPWTSLRFPDKPQQEWRVDFWRNNNRQVRSQYSWGIYNRGDNCWPCQWGTITGIDGVRPGSGMSLMPAFVATQAGGREPDDAGKAGAWTNGKLMGEASLNAAYGITPSITAEATINPDFSQVEADAGQIEVNSTFALSYPEKRPFFQDGSDLWATFFRPVYTRSLNRPDFAVKLIGRPGATGFAALVAQDDATPFILPFAEGSALLEGGRSTSALARVRRAFGSQSHVGAIATTRRHEGGGYGSLAGVDAGLTLSENVRVTAQALLSATTEPDNRALTARLDGLTFDGGHHTAAFDGEHFTGRAFYAGIERSGRRWGGEISGSERSPTFRAESGFEPRNDQRKLDSWTAYTFYFDKGLIERIEPLLVAGRVWDCSDVKKDEWLMGRVQANLRQAQTQVWFEKMASNELFHGTRYGGITSHELGIQVRPSEALAGGAELVWGHRIARHDEVMGDEVSHDLWVNVRPHKRVLIEQTWEGIRSDNLATGERLFEGYIARSRLNVQLSREWSARLVLQYDDFSRQWNADPLVTFRLNPFSIFYAGSTRNYGTFMGEQEGIEDWRLASRSYFLKLQYLWQI